MKHLFKVVFTFLFVVMIFYYGCTPSNTAVNKSAVQVVDIDGNVYSTVTIGTQLWMVENLNVKHYRNGDEIPQEEHHGEWHLFNLGACCYYENNSSNGKIYGRLYNGYAIEDSRGLAPAGWHVASDTDWTKLINYLGGKNIAGKKMKSTSGWKNNGNGTNESGFNALPGGMRNGDMSWESRGDHEFEDIGKYGSFWASTNIKGTAGLYTFSYNDTITSLTNVKDDNLKIGYSIRCVKD